MAAELRAPHGKFRVVGVDTFDRTDWVQGDFETLEEALETARSRGETMLKMHVYDDKGNHLGEAGRFKFIRIVPGAPIDIVDRLTGRTSYFGYDNGGSKPSKGLSPLVEVGAGTGAWSRLLAEKEIGSGANLQPDT